MKDQMIQNNSNALTTMREQSPLPCLARNLLVTAQIMGKDLMPEEIEVWNELLKPYLDHELDYAFKNHLQHSNFFPKPAEIISFIDSNRRAEKVHAEQVKKLSQDLAEEKEIRRRLESGDEQIPFSRIMEKFRQIVGIRPKAKVIEIRPERRVELQKQAEYLKEKRDGASPSSRTTATASAPEKQV